MKWLKYQHKFSSGRSAWQWKPLDDDATEESVRDDGVLSDITDEYNHSEKYSGIDFEVVDKAPRWIIERQIKTLGGRLIETEAAIKEFVGLLANGGVDDCKQCNGSQPATAAAAGHYAAVPDMRVVNGDRGTWVAPPTKSNHSARIEPCPTCGREIIVSTLAFWLMPDDKDAVKLLGSLVEQGARSVKGKKFRWPVEDEDEEVAFGRLVKLGLAGGSSYQDVREIHATDRGKAEWLKHKGAL